MSHSLSIWTWGRGFESEFNIVQPHDSNGHLQTRGKYVHQESSSKSLNLGPRLWVWLFKCPTAGLQRTHCQPPCPKLSKTVNKMQHDYMVHVHCKVVQVRILILDCLSAWWRWRQRWWCDDDETRVDGLGTPRTSSLAQCKNSCAKTVHGAWSMEHVVRSGPNFAGGREPAGQPKTTHLALQGLRGHCA